MLSRRIAAVRFRGKRDCGPECPVLVQVPNASFTPFRKVNSAPTEALDAEGSPWEDNALPGGHDSWTR